MLNTIHDKNSQMIETGVESIQSYFHSFKKDEISSGALIYRINTEFPRKLSELEKTVNATLKSRLKELGRETVSSWKPANANEYYNAEISNASDFNCKLAPFSPYSDTILLKAYIGSILFFLPIVSYISITLPLKWAFTLLLIAIIAIVAKFGYPRLFSEAIKKSALKYMDNHLTAIVICLKTGCKENVERFNNEVNTLAVKIGESIDE